MNTSKKKYSVAFLVIFVASQLMAAPMAGAAEKGYRYWGYFKAAPKATVWTSSMTGPTVDVTDGSVEGWTFTFSSDSIPDAKSPKIAPNFESLCAKTKPVAGKKRIGVVIDFGSAALRPKGDRLQPAIQKCIVTDQGSQGIDVLGAAVKIRAASSGFVCGINGYPAKECGVEIPTPRYLTNSK